MNVGFVHLRRHLESPNCGHRMIIASTVIVEPLGSESVSLKIVIGRKSQIAAINEVGSGLAATRPIPAILAAR